MICINRVLNERKIAEQIIENGYLDNNPVTTLVILARYYLTKDMNNNYKGGLERGQVEKLLDEYMALHFKRYNPVLWYGKISNVVSQANSYLNRRIEKGKRPLIEIDSVHITLSELNKIKQLKSTRLERLAFSLLVHGKLSNQINENMNYWVNEEFKVFFKDAKLTDGRDEQNKLLNKLLSQKYIETSRKVDSRGIRVLFADDTDEIVLTITNFNGFIYEYLKWTGKNVKQCTVCGESFIGSNRQIYCKKHSRKINQTKNNYKK